MKDQKAPVTRSKQAAVKAALARIRKQTPPSGATLGQMRKAQSTDNQNGIGTL